MTLGSTPLTEMSTWNISWGVKQAGALGWKLYHLHVLTVQMFWESQPPGALRVRPGIALPLPYTLVKHFVFAHLICLIKWSKNTGGKTQTLWENYNEMGVQTIHLAPVRVNKCGLVNMVMNIRLPYKI